MSAMPAEAVLKRRVVPAHRLSPMPGARRRAAGTAQRHIRTVMVAKVSTPSAWCSTAIQIGIPGGRPGRPGRSARTTSRTASDARPANRRRPAARHAQKRTQDRPVAAASTRCAKWMRIERVGQIGNHRAVAERPGRAGERGAALGRHGGAHHGAERQQPGERRTRRPSGRSARQRPRAERTHDEEDGGQHQKRVAEMQRHRPGAVLIEHGEAAQRAPATSSSRIRTDAGPATAGRARRRRKADTASSQDQRAEQHAGDQAVHPLQHHLAVAVADVRDGGELAGQSAASGRSRSASRGRTGRSWWCGRRRPGRSGHRSGWPPARR